MFSRCYSATTQGIDAYLIEIESHIENMSPNFIMVGLPDSAVKESKERVLASMKNSGIGFDPSRRITINLAPADIRKEGSAFDLPIALGLLAASGMIDEEKLRQFVVLGELALDGAVRLSTDRLISAYLSVNYRNLIPKYVASCFQPRTLRKEHL